MSALVGDYGSGSDSDNDDGEPIFRACFGRLFSPKLAPRISIELVVETSFSLPFQFWVGMTVRPFVGKRESGCRLPFPAVP